jgi:cellobiose-specific phosphotransferase system component IIC
MSTNHAVFNVIFRFVENYVSPVAGRISSQRHVMAIRDGFISAMPFMIVGSFLLVLPIRRFLRIPPGDSPVRGWIWQNSLKAKSSHRLI